MTGSFSQVRAELPPRAEAIAIARIVASTDRSLVDFPSTSRWASAVTSRSRKAPRSAIALASPPAANTPRPGWSAAMRNTLRPMLSIPRSRFASALETASGSNARSVVSRAIRSDIDCPPEERVDLVGGRHGVGARETGRDDRAGRARERERALQIPAREEPVNEGAAERV